MTFAPDRWQPSTMDQTDRSILAAGKLPYRRQTTLLARCLGGALALLMLAGCQADEMNFGSGPKHLREVPKKTRVQMAELKMTETSPVLMRIFKEENVFEVWKKDRTGRYALLKSYEICKWSGDLGPKIREGDRQAPEGYYAITPALMNPNSSYHLAFNTGFPNTFDRVHGRTGTHLMVHGACSSRGCYAMSDEQIQEIYALARDAFRGGQTAFQLAAYPFRMTPENMARHIDSPNMPFWRMLKEGYDHFELTRQEPKVDFCGRKYVFNAIAEAPLDPTAECPVLTQPEALRIAAAKKAAEDDAMTKVIVARIAEEKKAEEERLVMMAAREDERRLRVEEREIALAQRKEAITALLGIGGAPAETAVSVLPAELPTVSEDGRPLPRPAPRGEPVMAIMPAEEQAERSRSMFARLFSTSEPSRAATMPAASAQPADAPPMATSAGSAIATSSAACPPTATPTAGHAHCPTQGDATERAVAADNRSIMDRIGSWF